MSSQAHIFSTQHKLVEREAALIPFSVIIPYGSLIRCFMVAVAFVSIVSNSINAQETIALRDAQGREIKALIKKVANDEATISRADGQSFAVPISKFGLQTQNLLLNWNNRDILVRTASATQRAADVRARRYGESSSRTLSFRNSAGEAMLAAGNFSSSIDYLKKTADLWNGSNASRWGAHYARHLLGYAMLLNESNKEAEKLFVEGADGMLQTQDTSSQPKNSILLMIRASNRVHHYFESSNPSQSKRWKQSHEGFLKKLQAADSLPFDIGKMRTRETTHFTLASPYSSTRDLVTIIETIWEDLAAITPSMNSDFEKGNFRSPDYKKAPPMRYGEDEQFRYLIVLADAESLEPIIANYLTTFTSSLKRDEASVQLSDFKYLEEPKNRFLSMQTKDFKLFKDPGNNGALHRLIHYLPESLIKLTLRTDKEPSWLTLGLNYHFEHKLLGTASIHYSGSDFDQAGLIKNTDWHGPMKKLAGSSIPIMNRVIGSVARQQGEDYGYAWALIEMLLSSPEKKALLGDFILQMRQNRSSMNDQEIALWFGYETPDEMGRALTDFIQSKEFR